MADLDSAAMSDALKEYYDESKLTDIVALASPFMAELRKGAFLGKGVPYPMITDPGQAALSGTFATANSGRVGATYDRFLMSDPGRIYAIGGIERDVIDLASSPRGAFEDVRAEVGAKLDFVARELAHTLFRTENGVCGVIQSIAEGGGNTTITVTDPADIANLGPGAPLLASATAAGAVRSATTYIVDEIDHVAGTIVFNGQTAATTDSWAAADFLHRNGSAPNGSSAIYMSGLDDWIPSVTTGLGTAFRGVTRDANPTKLAGIRVAATSSQVREAASEMAARIIANGGRPDRLYVNPLRYAILEQELDSHATVEKIRPGNISAQVGFNALRVAAGSGSVMIVADPFCPFYRGYMLTMNTWKFHEIGGKRQPRMRDMGNGDFLQQQDADAVKFQCEAKGDLGCSNPGRNGVIVFS